MITSTKNPLVKQLVRLRTSARLRRQEQAVLVVGSRALREAAAHADLQMLLLPPPQGSDAGALETPSGREAATRAALREAGLRGAVGADAADVTFADERVLRKISGMPSLGRGSAVGCVALPEPSIPAQLERLLVLSGVSDPGNVGTLLRTALGLGWDAAFLLEPEPEPEPEPHRGPWPRCADPFGEKALRAAAGAAFALPIVSGGAAELRRVLAAHSLPLFVADVAGDPAELPRSLPDQLSVGSRAALCLSSEAHGAARLPELLRVASEGSPPPLTRVGIPMSQGSDSLSVS